jgi:hypothetical protein
VFSNTLRLFQDCHALRLAYAARFGAFSPVSEASARITGLPATDDVT